MGTKNNPGKNDGSAAANPERRTHMNEIVVNEILETGKSVLLRTVTMAHVGRVVSVDAHFICLEEGGWVADTGRFSNALSEGVLAEFEKAPGKFLVARGGLIDIFPWSHALPSKTL